MACQNQPVIMPLWRISPLKHITLFVNYVFKGSAKNSRVFFFENSMARNEDAAHTRLPNWATRCANRHKTRRKQLQKSYFVRAFDIVTFTCLHQCTHALKTVFPLPRMWMSVNSVFMIRSNQKCSLRFDPHCMLTTSKGR